jgi:predicted alpha/beta hydrolase family esterase
MSMTDARVLILHGYMHHRDAGHWLRWLTGQLQDRRIPVQYPQMPDADTPRQDAWLELAHRELEIMGPGERVIVAHSLGTVLWHHLVAGGATADRVLLVGPPSHDVLTGDLGGFSLAALGESAVGKGAPTTVIGRERDPYRSTPLAELTHTWQAETVVLPGEGHINMDDGHGPFPLALEWVAGQV